MRFNLILLFTAGSLVVSGADFWKDKKSSEWSNKEVKRILTNSPWAKEVTLDMGGGMPTGGTTGRGGGRRGGGMGGGMSSASIGSADMGGTGGRADGMEGGGGRAGGSGAGMDSGGAPVMNAPRVIVRWESAAPVREASRAAEVPYAARVAEWEPQYYVITTSGLPFGGRQQADPERTRQMQQRLRSSAALVAKGREPIPAEQVFISNGQSGATMIFLFRRAAAITAQDKDVTFQMGAGAMQIKAKFHPRDMEYEGRLAL